MTLSSSNSYRGWVRPGPIPPGGVEAEEGETLDYLCGHYRIFQYAKGHRYSTDDVLTAWYGTTCAPRVDRALDLGSGIGSVALIAAWRLPGAQFVTIEAQETSIRLAKKSVAYNGLESRFNILRGDLRDASIAETHAPFDLVLGSPPYFPPGTAVAASHEQAVGARIETRGDLRDYARAAAKALGPGGVFAFVFPAAQSERVAAALAEHALVLIRRRDVVFREGDRPLIALFVACRAGDVPATLEAAVETPLTIRMRDGSVATGYSAIRMSFGFPPGNVPAASEPA